tara:strand:+ start:2085 stop:2348 length:264 start_codon:yes stop_codon:yes gene_type:complete
MIREGCRHYSPDRDYCDAQLVSAPIQACKGCDMFEPHGRGLGDVVEKVIDVATLGLAKKVKKAKKGGCGCNKRRAALNRLTGGDAGG